VQPSFAFGDFPRLTTERLELCEPDSRHAADVFLFKRDPEVQLYNGVPHRALDDTLRSIATAQELYRQKKEVTWSLRMTASQRVVGGVSVFDWDTYHRRAQLGYDLARDCWGKGLAQEAIRAILRFAFECMALHRMEIWTSSANLRSLRLAERLGFQRDGTLRRRILEDDGQFHDGTIWGLLREDWQR
jgi:[ribosomal protein S5]-alanine N-acetyltransferase